MRKGARGTGARAATVLVVVGVFTAAGCRTEPAPQEFDLATFDSVLAELGGPATAALDRGERWRMIASMGAGLPPINWSADLLPERGSQGARLVQFYCVQCHGLPVPHMHTPEEWPVVLRRMILRMRTLSRHMGGRITERMLGEMRIAGMAATELPSLAEQDTLLAYLQRHAFPGMSPERLPEGDGREAYIRQCSLCHTTPDPSAHDPDGWRAVVNRMQANMSAMDVAPLSDRERERVLGYLRQVSR